MATELSFGGMSGWIMIVYSYIRTFSLVRPELIDKTVEFVDLSGKWNWRTIQHYLPISICLRIAAVVAPNIDRDEDRLFLEPLVE